ncbi:MAG: hypothetical protein CML06_13825 [Pseudomonadales bacterium]|nr:hypothetical protein [Pseudomonadales bacterium]|tara:strand:- start:206 stop:571 length:366 start_codon:yes stop_codon:yes gene_type:complete
MSEVSEFEGISGEDVQIIQAIIKSFYGSGTAARFNSSTISEETVKEMAVLLTETADCSQWMDAVPNPSDILMPTKNLKKWALRLLRNAGKPFLTGTEGVTVACKNVRAAQFKHQIILSLKY